jgi:transformation/transcription domain-associated protein
MSKQSLSVSLQECLIDPLAITWFKKLHKFYLDPYWDKFQIARNLNTPGGATSTNAPNSLNNTLANNQNIRLRGILAIVNDPNYQITRQKFLLDFNYQPSQHVNTFTFIQKLKSWINLFELHIRSQPKQQLLDDRFKFVTQFCSTTAEIEIPGEFLIPRATNYCVRISRFLPRYESIEKFNSYMRRISIRGHNGKIYPFLIANEGNPERTYYDGRKEEHVMQLMRMLNSYLSKQKETASRNLFFTLPRVVSLSVDVRMIEDDCSAVSLLDIYKKRNRKLSNLMAQQQQQQQQQKQSKSTANLLKSADSSHSQKVLEYSEAGDLPITRFFERLQSSSAAAANTSMSSNDAKLHFHQSNNNNKHILMDAFKHISTTLVPKNIFKEWATFTYSDATDYFHFRKMFTSQLAMYNLAEYAFQLTRLNPDQFYVSQNSGVCQAIRLKFDLCESQNSPQNSSGGVQLSQLISGFNADRAVPFRLTPNVTEFITSAGVSGPFNSILVALARCLVQPQYHFVWLLRAILKDELLICLNRKKSEENLKNPTPNSNLSSSTQSYGQSEIEAETLIDLVNKLVSSIESRLKNCAALEGGKNFVTNELIPKSMNIENLSNMDPLWYPWF